MSSQDHEKGLSLEQAEEEGPLSTIREDDALSGELPNDPVERKEDQYAADGPQDNPWGAPNEDREASEGVPGWPKNWPRWLVRLVTVLIFITIRGGFGLISNYVENSRWFDGVEEAGFHAEAVDPGEDPYVWIGKAGDGMSNKDADLDGYYWYSINQEQTGASAILSLVEGNKSVMLCSKTPITSKGSAKYMKIEGHRIGHNTIRYTKAEQKLPNVVKKCDKLPVYEVDKVSYGSYIALAHPLLRTMELNKTQTNGNVSVTLQEVEYREGLILCFFSLDNNAGNDKTACMNRTEITASFSGQALQVNTYDWQAELTASSIQHLLLDNLNGHGSFAFYRRAEPGNGISGVLPVEGTQGNGELKIHMDVFMQGEEIQETLPFDFTCYVQKKGE